ncbi:anaerobic ribonucleoside-triphosphate reductase-activating domain protein, partial [Escherichia coli P0304777.3]
MPDAAYTRTDKPGEIMNYHQYYPVDIVNGPGTRCTLFVSG